MATNNGPLSLRLVPDHFVFNKSCPVVAIYNKALDQGAQGGVTLMFSGGTPDAAPIRVVAERVDSRTLLFNSPVYSKLPPSKSVSVLPILFTTSSSGHGEVQIELPPFQIRVQDLTRNLIEASIGVFAQEDLLPVLIMFMLHHKGDQRPFRDERFDKVMTCLVENRDLQSSSSIKDIILPGKKWQRMTIHDFCIEHELPSTTKASKPLKEGRRLRAKSRQETSSTVQDLHSIYTNLNHHRSLALQFQDNVYDTPTITVKKNSSSSLVGEPIDPNNPPAHFLYPPGSGTESDASDTYSNLDSRPFTHSARNVHSDGDTPPILTRRFKQQQQHSDSVDSALNRMGTQRRHNNSSLLTPQSPLFLSNDANSNTSSNTATTATLSSQHDAPMPLPRSTQPQGEPYPIVTRRDSTGPTGQKEHQPRPVPRPRKGFQPTQSNTPPPNTVFEDVYDDIMHVVPRDTLKAGEAQPHGVRQPPQVAKKPTRQC